MMALGRSSSFGEDGGNYSECSSDLPETYGQDDDGSELIECLRRIGRKRIRVPSRSGMAPVDLRCDSKCLKLMASTVSGCGEESLNLETLPLDVLIRILCGVEYDDLEQLFLVSKGIREAALIAKESHFAFSTPKARRRAARSTSSDSLCSFGRSSLKLDETEAPNAPIRRDGYAGKGFHDFLNVLNIVFRLSQREFSIAWANSTRRSLSHSGSPFSSGERSSQATLSVALGNHSLNSNWHTFLSGPELGSERVYFFHIERIFLTLEDGSGSSPVITDEKEGVLQGGKNLSKDWQEIRVRVDEGSLWSGHLAERIETGGGD
ncbi:F-box protein [Nymphaea thermarum]|nr:F-box protein [Nymphaea thermarum]